MQTDNLELKKLVYLYLMTYAKTNPKLALMAVNTFVKVRRWWLVSPCSLCFQDCVDPNPLIRALAVRTMGCIRVDKITEYLCEPLRKCLKDSDPYVKKTAAVCVAKLYDIEANLVEDQVPHAPAINTLLTVYSRVSLMLCRSFFQTPTPWSSPTLSLRWPKSTSTVLVLSHDGLQLLTMPNRGRPV